MENWKSNVFVSFFLFKSLTTSTQGEMTIFFPSGCFSKVSSELLPIWLRKTKAPVTDCVHNPLCGLEAFPTYRCYKRLLMLFQGPTVSPLLQTGKTEWWVRFYLSCGMTHATRVYKAEGWAFFAWRTPPPSFLTFRSSGRFPFTLSDRPLPQISNSNKTLF